MSQPFVFDNDEEDILSIMTYHENPHSRESTEPSRLSQVISEARNSPPAFYHPPARQCAGACTSKPVVVVTPASSRPQDVNAAVNDLMRLGRQAGIVKPQKSNSFMEQINSFWNKLQV